MDKNWAGEAEFKCWTGVAGLLALLAASKTSTDTTTLTVELDETTPEDANRYGQGMSGERGAVDVGTAVVIFCLVLILFALLGVIDLR